MENKTKDIYIEDKRDQLIRYNPDGEKYYNNLSNKQIQVEYKEMINLIKKINENK